MKYILSLLFITMGCSSIAEIPTVTNLDLNEYTGTWFEIAKIPNRFQDQCVGTTTAEYQLIEESEFISVVNKCELKSGDIETIEGRARVDSEFNDSARLEVTFAKIFGRWIFSFGGGYWVTELGDNYSYSLVSSPDLKFGWILSRSPSLDNSTLLSIQSKLESLGYDPCNYIMSNTPSTKVEQNTSLCGYLEN